MIKSICTMSFEELSEIIHEFEYRLEQIDASLLDLNALSNLYSFANFLVYHCQREREGDHSIFNSASLRIRTNIKTLWKSAEPHGVMPLDDYENLIASLLDAFHEIDELYCPLVAQTLNHFERSQENGGGRPVDVVEFVKYAGKLESTIALVNQLLDTKIIPALESMQRVGLTYAIPAFRATFKENNYSHRDTVEQLLEQHQLPVDIVRRLILPTCTANNADIDYAVNSSTHPTRPILRSWVKIDDRRNYPTYYIGGSNNDGRILRFFRLIELSLDIELRQKEFNILKYAHAQEFKYTLATARYEVSVLHKLEIDADCRLKKLSKRILSERTSKLLNSARKHNDQLRHKLLREDEVPRALTTQWMKGIEILPANFTNQRYQNERASEELATSLYPDVVFLSYPELVEYLESLSITVEKSDLLYNREGSRSVLPKESSREETTSVVRESDVKRNFDRSPITNKLDHSTQTAPRKRAVSIATKFFGVMLCATSAVVSFFMGVGVTVSDDMSAKPSAYVGIILFVVLAWVGYRLANSVKTVTE